MMDILLMVETLAEEFEKYNYWVGNNGLYDHLLILIQLKKENIKPPFPFKFKHDWLDKEYFRLRILVDEIQLLQHPHIARKVFFINLT